MTKEIHIPDDTYRGLKALLFSSGKDVGVDEFASRTLNPAVRVAAVPKSHWVSV